ncbi:MAG: LysE family translocator [Desulfobacterales bacterium]|nr:LysE family translocator [Desulfobacterales bacterium]
MFSALTAGILLGLSAGFAPGPLLTLVIAQTLKHNVREGIKVALAPLISDFPIILISLLVLTRLTHQSTVLGLISACGGFYVLYLAYESFNTGPLPKQLADERPKSLRKGSLINLLNPNPYLFWVTVGTPLILKTYQQTMMAPLIFIGCFYGLLIGSKIFLALMIGRSRSLLAGRGYQLVMRILGGLLGLFAAILFKDALSFFRLA